MSDYDLAVDFMDLTADRRLWARAVDIRSDFTPIAGYHVVVGNEDADAAVARILSVDGEGIIELLVLPGTVESHRDLLAQA